MADEQEGQGLISGRPSSSERVPLWQRQTSVLPNVNPANLANPRVQANAYQGWQNAAVTSPKLFWFAILLAVAEIIASIIIVKQSWELECDKILTTFVIGFTSRYFVLLPILIHRYYNQEQPVDTGIQTLKGCVELYVFVWWIMGQVWYFGSKTCGQTAPTLFTYTLVLICFYYVVLLMPVALITLLCICMPLMFILIRLCSEPRGAPKDMIDKMPIARFKKSDADDDSKRHDESSSTCGICMEDYAEDDELLVMPCKHLFHKKCIRGWLPISKTCPFCRFPITGRVEEDDHMV